MDYVKLFFFFLVLLTVNTHRRNINLALGRLWDMSFDLDLAFPQSFTVSKLCLCTLSCVT